jgi:Protein kinase domain/FHA domain
LVPGSVNRIYVWVTDRSTNGTYINGIKMPSGVPVQLCPDDHITLLKRDNASDSRPNIGFRIIMALQKPKLEDYYAVLKGDILGSGTFGAVHKARNLKTNKIVAVKMIRSLRGSSLSQDLEREIRIMKKLDHVCLPFYVVLIVAEYCSVS